ncbi:MAG TPA: hypothetical protein VF338_07145 [Leptolinea sp.]
MDLPEKPVASVSSSTLITGMVAGLFFMAMSVQVLFPKLPIPFLGVLAAALTSVDFICHEIGHILFGFLGEFIAVLGGTLSQLFLPVVCLLLTLRKRQWFSVSFFGFWIGQSLIQISTYIKDAQAQKLKLFSPGTLFGGGSPIHDWHYLLGTLNLLWADQFLGWSVFSLGFILMMLSAGLMFARAAGYVSNQN